MLFNRSNKQNCFSKYKVIKFCLFLIFLSTVYAKCNNTSCGRNGVCKNGSCVCQDGWQGDNCHTCGSKIRLEAPTGTIFDGHGNYSVNSKCSWLIYAPNSNITFHIEDFATECGWDYLYIFDGDNVNSTLLAAFSGSIYRNSYTRKIPEVSATSGAALVHFSSDSYSTMSGFNITYRLNSCPTIISNQNCSGNGVCSNGNCVCNKGWTGQACHINNCPNDCGFNEGHGYCEHGEGCSCIGRYTGSDCSQNMDEGYWKIIPAQSFTPPGSASHGTVVWKDLMYVTAGESYSKRSFLYIYNFTSSIWKISNATGNPSSRYGHSTVLYDDKIFLYGGVLKNKDPTSELWIFDIKANTWENITVTNANCNYSICTPLKSTGHTATVIFNDDNRTMDKMVVIFGYSPQFGYLNIVQEYYFNTKEWHIVPTKGYPVTGAYGHSASWDEFTSKIYVYGGANYMILNKQIYSYEPYERVWTLLSEAPSARFFHSASFLKPGLLLAFGGRTPPSNNKCYSSEMLSYDVLCDTWSVLPVPEEMREDIARFGHSAVVFENSLYIYGGFDGEMLSDMLQYTPGDCSVANKTECLETNPGINCVWNSAKSVCMHLFKNNSRFIKQCSYPMSPFINKKQKCEEMRDCSVCTYTSIGCMWLNNACIPKNESSNLTAGASNCISDPTVTCESLYTCNACNLNRFCYWNPNKDQCQPRIHPNTNMMATKKNQCKKVCSHYDSCSSCTRKDCIWCHNENRCFDKDGYLVSFPYGQCREWTINKTECRDSKSHNGFYKTCSKCRQDPSFGWCDDGSGTGTGSCLPGGYKEPSEPFTCPQNRWYFTSCPLCQCNGHSRCEPNTSQCVSCNNFTTGNNCERCKKGYWGDPLNGGECVQCDCKNKGEDCNKKSGKCYCKIKGTIGDNCDKCEMYNHYDMDPDDKLCYYILITDYQFTFNISKQQDRHYTQINFKNFPTKSDIDVDFVLAASKSMKVNITIKEPNSPEREIISNLKFSNFSERFFHDKYNFSVSTFIVYVYDFHPPVWIRVSFAQPPKLNIRQFLLTLQTIKHSVLPYANDELKRNVTQILRAVNISLDANDELKRNLTQILRAANISLDAN